jgi:AcrR family transcriptional regulator
VLDATLAELGRVGYGRLRIDDVAARACVNKTSIYRRWADKPGLVCAAMRTMSGDHLDADCGSLRADLLQSFQTNMRGWATDRGRGLLRMLIAEAADPTVDRLARRLRERHKQARRRIVLRALDRGELPPGTDIDLLIEVLTNTVVTHVRHRPGPLDPDWLERVIDLLLPAAISRPAGARATNGARRASSGTPRT